MCRANSGRVQRGSRWSGGGGLENTGGEGTGDGNRSGGGEKPFLGARGGVLFWGDTRRAGYYGWLGTTIRSAVHVASTYVRADHGSGGDHLLRTSVCSHRRQRVQYRAHAGMSTFTGASSTPWLPAATPSDLTAGPRLTPLPDSGHKKLQRSGASPTVARDTAAGRPSSRCRLWQGRGAGRAPRWCVTPPAGQA